jgi:uncharacterized protein YcbK (DUF882 family)
LDETGGQKRGNRGMGVTCISRRWRVAAMALLASVFSIGSLSALPEGDRALKIYHIHTGETATIVFKRNGVYDKDGLQKLNYILRDWRKERPTNMDPHLFDLLWQVYQASGATEPIHVVCGFRSPETNAMLRRRSKGVAQHSQHMLGKATDFFIPGVPLDKLRAIGLRMQIGGVGYYPTSGSPFVHMDTGSVRMWPRMTHDQLARVFPDGKTLYVPSDGRPLPGYDSALAAFKSRKAGSTPVMLADNGDENDDNDAATAASKKVIVLTPRSAALEVPVPLPRRAPPRPAPALEAPAMVAMAEPQPPIKPLPLARERLNSIFDRAFPETDAADAGRRPAGAGKRPGTLREVDFDATYGAAAPPVPPTLARAMAARDQSGRYEQVASASLPIQPTAIVATVEVTRPLRAATMTAAAFSGSGDTPADVGDAPALLAYASPDDASVPEKPKPTRNPALGTRVPVPAPIRASAGPAAAPIESNVEVLVDDHLYAKLQRAELTLTALDTQGLRLWMAAPSTREKRYALLTMPDFSQQPSLLDKPVVTYASGFGHSAYQNLRTDSFAGQLVQPLAVVDLTRLPTVAAK